MNFDGIKHEWGVNDALSEAVKCFLNFLDLGDILQHQEFAKRLSTETHTDHSPSQKWYETTQ